MSAATDAQPARARNLHTLITGLPLAAPPPATDPVPVPRATTPGLLADVVAAWLGEVYGRNATTGNAYCSAMRLYLTWCAQAGVDPLQVGRRDASRFAAWLGQEPSSKTGRGRSASNIAQVLSAASSLVEYAVADTLRPEWARNPFPTVARPVPPRVPRPAPLLTLSQLNRLMLAAREDHVLGGVLGKVTVALLGMSGLRPGDVCRLNVSGVADDGHDGYELYTRVKGGGSVSRWLGPHVASDVATYLRAARVAPDPELAGDDPVGDDPLLVHPRLWRRLNTDDVRALVKRAAVRAGIAAGAELCPRHFRPSWNTLVRAGGAQLEDRQKALGHARATTTGLYDRTVWSRERDPAILLDHANEAYPGDELARPMEWATSSRAAGKDECDCTPPWRTLRVWLGPVGIAEYGHAVVADGWLPGTHALDTPQCPVCLGRWRGPFRVRHVPDDPHGELLRQCEAALVEQARFGAALDRRDEQERPDTG